ncbi:hypothetical protein GCM10023317_50740 [Actinopolymorpha pittospori]|uniref:Uncharacterized protein n=1 Tax=Actinopolymorpha pittospori TaxID=648752 RepID=A0A927R763_9ACTN|nr:hypothetical protein [Actinopolymorpha pittospori]
MRAEDEFGDGPAQRGWAGLAAELRWDLQPPPLRVHPGVIALLQRVTDANGAGLPVEDGRGEVGLGEGGGDVLAGEALDLAQDAARGVEVDVGIATGAEQVGTPEHVEERELDVTEIALVVAHRPPQDAFRRGGGVAAAKGYLRVTSA